MDKLTWMLSALAAGAALPLQGGVNSKLGKALANPSYAALVSFSIGALALMAYVLVTRQSPSWECVKQASWFYWTGGILGAAYVTTVIFDVSQAEFRIDICLDRCWANDHFVDIGPLPCLGRPSTTHQSWPSAWSGSYCWRSDPSSAILE